MKNFCIGKKNENGEKEKTQKTSHYRILLFSFLFYLFSFSTFLYFVLSVVSSLLSLLEFRTFLSSPTMLSAEEIRKIANLAHLELTEKEVEKFSRELSDILDFFNQLQEVNTDNVEPTAQVTGLRDIMREDAEKNCDYSEKLLSSSPNAIEKSQITVKSVF